jgi:hypothetical protein
MGVEYRQFYIARDPAWSGSTQDAVPQVHAMLRDWNLVVGEPIVYDFAQGQCTKLSETIETIIIPENVGIAYPEVFSNGTHVQEAIERILGPSYYGEETRGDRYLQKLQFVAGHDIRIHPSGDLFSVEVECEEIIEPEHPWTSTFWGTIVHQNGAAWPRSKLLKEDSASLPPSFTGLWRCALMLDCGKDLPSFCAQTYSPPGIDFRRAFEIAIDSEVIEMGLVY